MYQKIRLNPSMTVKASLKSQRKSQHTENNSKTSAFSDNCDQMKNENITETDYVSVKYYQQDEVNNTNSKTDHEKQDEASNNQSSELPESIQSSHNSSSFSYNVSVLKTDKEDRIWSESQHDSDVSNVSPVDTGFHVNEMMFVEKNIVTNACDSYAKILHILRDWESNIDNIQSFSTNILTFPKDQKHQSTPQLYGNENGNDNDDNNEQGNNNQQHENNRKNNGKHNKQNKDRKDDNNEDRNEKKDNNAKKNYDCNIQWHATIIRCLEHKVHDQSEEIKALKRQLCQQTNCNTLMKIDIALAKYYKRFGVNYLFIQGNGLLSQFVLKNNLNESNSLLINILSSKFNSQNSIYTRFDEAFPFPNFINVEQLTNKQKEEIIFSIIQYCFRHNEPPSFDEIQNKWDEIQYKQQKCILNKQECKREDKKDNVIYSRRLIREVIPKHIAENIVNISDYMKKHILIYGDTALIETTDRKHAIIDYNFHCKRTKQSVYVVADKIRDKVAGNVWKLRHDLSYGFQVEKKFDISISALKLKPIDNIKIKFMDKIQKIKQMLQIKNVRDNITQCKYVKWEKVQIHARKSTSPLSLTLTNTDFVRRFQKFVNNNTNNINLLPIAIFNENKYCIHIIWLVDIGYGTIGIALKINKSKLIVCGIYLDIHDAHLLVPKHKCNCLPFSHCKIDDLTIGTKINGEQMVRQNKSLKIQINDANKSIKKLQRLCEIDSVCLTKIKDVLKQGDIQQLLISLLEKQDELKQQYGIYQEKQYELQQQQDEHQKIINSLIVKMNSMPTSPNQLMLQSVLH